MNSKTMVIAVNAVSGGGKTTITKELVGRLKNAKALYFDDYDGIDDNVPDIHQWVEDGADYDLWELQSIADDIIQVLAEGSVDYIILDYPFAYKQRQVAGFIDWSVYIDTPLDVALARRIIRDFSLQGRADTILQELDAYLYTRSAYFYSQAVNKDADLTVDGNLDTAAIVDIIIKKLAEKMGETEKNKK